MNLAQFLASTESFGIETRAARQAFASWEARAEEARRAVLARKNDAFFHRFPSKLEAAIRHELQYIHADLMKSDGMAIENLSRPPTDEQCQTMATTFRAWNISSSGSFFLRLQSLPELASEYFCNEPMVATALLRAGFSPMAYTEAQQAACFDRTSTDSRWCPEIQTRGLELGWNPDASKPDDISFHPAAQWIWSWASGRREAEICAEMAAKIIARSETFKRSDALRAATANDSGFKDKEKIAQAAINNLYDNLELQRALRSSPPPKKPSAPKAKI